MAKIRELEEAVVSARALGDVASAEMFNAEIIPLLIKVTDAIRDSKADRGADTRER